MPFEIKSFIQSVATMPALSTMDTGILTGLGLACAGSFLEHAIYSFVWLAPVNFRKYMARKVDPIPRLHTYLTICKCIQAGGALAYLHPHVKMPDFASPVTLAALAAIGCGQFLNFSVYKAIGKTGVYYGNKFGISIPWCTDFPYNTPMPHPQYLGATMSYFGLYFLLLPDLPLDYFKVFAAGIATSYITMSNVEQHL